MSRKFKIGNTVSIAYSASYYIASRYIGRKGIIEKYDSEWRMYCVRVRNRKSLLLVSPSDINKIKNASSLNFVPIKGNVLRSTNIERCVLSDTIEDFSIGKYTVTNKEYNKYLKSIGKLQITKDENYPVINVSHYDATKYCKWLTATCNDGCTYRLPTEAEWEYACRAGSTSAYHFGNNVTKLKDYAWYEKNSKDRVHPVGKKLQNAWGLYDMHGNVWEWCSTFRKYLVPSTIKLYVMCGGSFSSYDSELSSSSCALGERSYYDPCIGFRVVKARK